ncbi:HNH endonuclease [Clostridium perfringens]|uniref:HNH endonuclease n=1 Tax=Clostridium perfringens TaxID=1502 RepID=UPI0013E32AF9|nr:HNH endonuclease [Clostridium perfringens]MBI6055111.1 HNH endonuclease [Clostridium perfringens]MBO3324955.1 HNH endonuclease [Clostridium perfringens]MDT7916921.1 HNH endonuclease [Clostridium perfringens]MDT7936147.1 HNH endonuclease [Clostridium perfringens]MDT7939293.1 HNH endonuclease [Clostridium perfringens]
MLMKLCAKCGDVIEYGNRYCATCTDLVEQQKKKDNKKRYKKYSNVRLDKEEQSFYQSKAWKNMRSKVLADYVFIDVYYYYKYNKIVQANTVHHIIEVKEDWDKRLDYYNLICVSKESHKEIHDLMLNKGKEKVKQMLLEFNKRFREEFNIKI